MTGEGLNARMRIALSREGVSAGSLPTAYFEEGDTICAPGIQDFPNDRGATSSDPSEDKPSDTRASRKDRDNLAVGFANQLTHSSGYFVLDADKIKDHTKSVGTYRINACSVGLGSIKFPSMNIGNVPTASTYGTRNPTFHTYDGVNK